MTNSVFDYVIHESVDWPPKVRPKLPFGPTLVEIIRSCPLRSCFDLSPNYQRRTSVSARIGIALHATIQYVSESPLADKSVDEVVADASERFTAEIKEQHARASERPREQSLLWDAIRTDRAAEAAIAESFRIFQTGNYNTNPNHRSATIAEISEIKASNQHAALFYEGNSIAVEVPVRSSDGKFKGRVDRAENTPAGVRLIDYKSAMRDDLPERYEKQLQLYSVMWHDTYGDWPIEAQVYYPLRGSFYSVDVTPSVCQQVASDAAILVANIAKENPPSHLASPGDVCKVCEFRPWCRPFWNSQSNEKKQMIAFDKAGLGFEGSVESINLTDHYWRILIAWRNAKVKLVTPQERFPHLANVRVGQVLRVLDGQLRGQLYEPSVHVNNYTEIFILEN